jgi:hypothetical protein
VSGSPIGVLVSSDQHNESAQEDFSRLVSMVFSGEVEGQVIEDKQSFGSLVPREAGDREVFRQGAARGALAGFVLGLVPLAGSTLLGAAAGALLAGASRLRFEKGSPPHLRFARYDQRQ